MENDFHFEDITFHHDMQVGEQHHDVTHESDSDEGHIEFGQSKDATGNLEGEQAEFPQLEGGDLIPVVKRKGFDDFHILKTIGQGSYGKVIAFALF
jgi:hypothetical protein